jgi:hypothetical protein
MKPDAIDQDAIDQDARWCLFSCKKRNVDFERATARGDTEGVRQTALMVSGTLGPERLRGLSQFQMRTLITSVAPQYLNLKDTIEQISRTFALGAVSDALSRLVAFESSAGKVHIWVKRPQFATCEALVRAAQNGEEDFQDYLIWLRSELGLIEGDLDAVLAMILLGMRREYGELILPGDMTVRRGGRLSSLFDFPDEKVFPKLREWALERHRNYGSRDGKELCRDQFSEIDRATLAADDAHVWGRFRWTAGVTVDWDAIANHLDRRTAGELRMKLAGHSVEEMGKANCEHFRTKLPAIRKLIINDQLHRVKRRCTRVPIKVS